MKAEDYYGPDDDNESGLHDEPMWKDMEDPRWEKHIEACARILDWLDEYHSTQESGHAVTADHGTR